VRDLLAGIEPKDVDVIYVGNMNGGFVRQEFHSSLALQAHPDLRFKLDATVDWDDDLCAALAATGALALYALDTVVSLRDSWGGDNVPAGAVTSTALGNTLEPYYYTTGGAVPPPIG